MGQFPGQFKTPAVIRITPFWLALTLFSGCSDEKTTPAATAQPDVATNPSPIINDAGSGTLAPAASSLVDISGSAVDHFCEVSLSLTRSLTAFSDHPSEETLLAARAAWQQTHESLMRIGYLKYLPIDHPVLDHIPVVAAPSLEASKTPTETNGPRLRIWQVLDQTPLFGGYLDYVAQYPFSGIVNSEIDITEQTLRVEFQFSDDMYVTTGFHAAEFMLWGEDGNRPVADFIAAQEKPEDHNQRAGRRLDLIKSINQALKTDTEKLCSAWAASPNYYVSKFRQYGHVQQQEIVLQTVKGALQLTIAAELRQHVEGAASDFHSAYSGNSMNDIKAALYSIHKILQEQTLQAVFDGSMQTTTEPAQPISTLALQLKDVIERLAQGAEKGGAKQLEKDDILQAEKALGIINEMVTRIDDIIDTH